MPSPSEENESAQARRILQKIAGERSQRKQAQKLVDILPMATQSLGLHQKVKELSLLSLWPELVPKAYVSTTRAVSVSEIANQMVLQVHVRDSFSASSLGFELETIRDRLNAYRNQTGIFVDVIRIRVAAIL